MLHIQTPVVNNPTFIEIQERTLKTFVQGTYDFTVFNDAKDFADFSNFGDTTVRRAINRTCERLNIPCVELHHPNHAWNTCPARRCADANNALLEMQRNTTDRFLVLDSDMFPIQTFRTDKYAAYDAAFVPQHRTAGPKAVDYFWNGIYYFNMATLAPKELLSWSSDDMEGVWTDVGGGMYKFLRASTNRFYKFPNLSSGSWGALDYPMHLDFGWLQWIQTDVRNTGKTFFSEIFDETFLHFRAGGNWEKRESSVFQERAASLQALVHRLCKN